MSGERRGQLLFVGSCAVACALYGLTACSGYPWSASTHAALGWSGVLSLPQAPYAVWGYFIRIFAGHYIALSACSAALSAGLLATVVNRHFGWRAGIGAAVIWMFWPSVWNAAVTGDRWAFVLLCLVAVLWLAQALALRVWAWLCAKLAHGPTEPAAASIAGWQRIARWNLLAARVFLGASALFALGSLTFHDYRLGEAATVYAQGIVDEARGRWIVLDGTVNDQVAAIRGVAETVDPLDLSDHYRTQLVARVRAKWPDRSELQTAAQVSPGSFAEAAVKLFPDVFYLMGGRSATLVDWERRWTEFAPYLTSSDPAIPTLRRAFAREGNAVANALQDAGGAEGTKRAWLLYWKIFESIDRGNFSALVNLSEMVRRGHAASTADREKINRALDDFFKDAHRREQALMIARLSGPVRVDRELLAKLREESKRRQDERKASGQAIPLSRDMQVLVERNNEMVRAMERGEHARASGLARRILSNPAWRSFAPANAVLGAVMASEGDYESSERFFRMALASGSELAVVSYNDFADTLLHLGKLDEAETYARKAVAESPDTFWLARLTLAEVLIARQKAPEESLALLQTVSKNCPAQARSHVRDLRRKVARP